jgi:hypothetical protein
MPPAAKVGAEHLSLSFSFQCHAVTLCAMQRFLREGTVMHSVCARLLMLALEPNESNRTEKASNGEIYAAKCRLELEFHHCGKKKQYIS